jgi:hypothetical protein
MHTECEREKRAFEPANDHSILRHGQRFTAEAKYESSGDANGVRLRKKDIADMTEGPGIATMVPLQ